MNPIKDNFTGGDADRSAIWEILVVKDTAAFLAADWSVTVEDFIDEGFMGVFGCSNPDHWRITYPDLASYREEWLKQAKVLAEVQLRGESREDFLYRATILRDIEIAGDRAAAHRKFDGSAETINGRPLELNWPTIYWLRRTPSGWRITGSLGYLPTPRPREERPAVRRAVPAGIPEWSFPQ